MTNKPKGGPREGAGRPPLAGKGKPKETVAVLINMTKPQREKLKALGGAQWVRGKIDEATDSQPPSQVAIDAYKQAQDQSFRAQFLAKLKSKSQT